MQVNQLIKLLKEYNPNGHVTKYENTSIMTKLKKMQVLEYDHDSIAEYEKELATIVAHNPYLLYAIPLNVCTKICKLFPLVNTNDHILMGKLLRLLVCVETSKEYDKEVGITNKPYYYVDIGIIPQIKSKETKKKEIEILTQSIFPNTRLPLLETYPEYDILCYQDVMMRKCIKDAEYKVYEFIKSCVVFHTLEITDIIIEQTLKKMKKEVTPEIMAAINMIFKNPVSIIYSSAGCGKTTVITAASIICNMYNIPILLCSFTGKAVEVLRKKLMIGGQVILETIHSFIAKDLVKDLNQLVVIIDETSMLSTSLFYDLTKTLKNIQVHLVFVGDIHQLGPFGNWGYIFEELLKTNLPRTELTKNYRTQDECGSIIRNALLFTGKDTEGKIEHDEAFKRIKEKPIDYVFSLYQRHTVGPVCMISPSNALCSEANLELQSKLFEDEIPLLKYTQFGTQEIKWYNGDKVVMLMNAPSHGIFNGSEGIVVGKKDYHLIIRGANMEIPEKGIVGLKKEDWLIYQDGSFKKPYKTTTIPALVVKFNTKEVEYFIMDKMGEMIDNEKIITIEDRAEILIIKHIQLAYCITIHKAQGSEWDHVVFSAWPSFNRELLSRNKIYTAITRAKRSVSYYCHEKYMDNSNLIDEIKRNDTLATYFNG